MEATLRSLLAELEEEGRRNDEQEQERSKKMLNLEPDTARLLSIFVRSGRRTRLLEIGTSNGYSTIWLAWAARVVGGSVITIDRDEHKQVLADTNLRRAGLRDAQGVRRGHDGHDAEAIERDAVEAPLFDLPAEDGVFAGEVHFGIGEARPGPDVAGAGLDILTGDACRTHRSGDQNHDDQGQSEPTKHS